MDTGHKLRVLVITLRGETVDVDLETCGDLRTRDEEEVIRILLLFPGLEETSYKGLGDIMEGVAVDLETCRELRTRYEEEDLGEIIYGVAVDLETCGEL